MGLEIVLQTELGAKVEAVADPKNLLGRLLPETDGEQYPLLGGIDPYADTIFNGLQICRFLLKWVDVSAKASTPEERDLVEKSTNWHDAAATKSTSTSDSSVTDEPRLSPHASSLPSQ